MSYTESLDRLRKILDMPPKAPPKLTKAPSVGSVGTPRGISGKTAPPSVGFVSTPPGHSEKTASTDGGRRTDPDPVRLAMERAAEGLPVTVPELLEAFGEEGARDFAEGYHCEPDYLRAFARAVSERLSEEREFQNTPQTVPTKPTRAPAIEPTGQPTTEATA